MNREVSLNYYCYCTFRYSPVECYLCCLRLGLQPQRSSSEVQWLSHQVLQYVCIFSSCSQNQSIHKSPLVYILKLFNVSQFSPVSESNDFIELFLDGVINVCMKDSEQYQDICVICFVPVHVYVGQKAKPLVFSNLHNSINYTHKDKMPPNLQQCLPLHSHLSGGGP